MLLATPTSGSIGFYNTNTGSSNNVRMGPVGAVTGSAAGAISGFTANNGGDTGEGNMPPFTVINYIIKY